MNGKTIIEKDKLGEIINFASEELERNSDNSIGKEAVVNHIINKMKEVLKDDN